MEAPAVVASETHGLQLALVAVASLQGLRLPLEALQPLLRQWMGACISPQCVVAVASSFRRSVQCWIQLSLHESSHQETLCGCEAHPCAEPSVLEVAHFPMEQ